MPTARLTNRGSAEERAIRQRRGAGEDSEHQDRKVKGRVTVSFSLTDPVRTSRYLAVPAYKCEGGGEVVVEITVNRGGRRDERPGGRRRGRVHALFGARFGPQVAFQHRRLRPGTPARDDYVYFYPPISSFCPAEA